MKFFIRDILFIAGFCAISLAGYTSTHAASVITVTSANKVVTIGLRRNTTLNTLISGFVDKIFVESANKVILVRQQLPPAALSTIYAARIAAIFVESADKTVTTSQSVPTSGLSDTYSTVSKHIFVEAADGIGLQRIVPIVLDGGVPTGTVARAGAIGPADAAETPTPTISESPAITPTP